MATRINGRVIKGWVIKGWIIGAPAYAQSEIGLSASFESAGSFCR
jgi:hypothetical protein